MYAGGFPPLWQRIIHTNNDVPHALDLETLNPERSGAHCVMEPACIAVKNVGLAEEGDTIFVLYVEAQDGSTQGQNYVLIVVLCLCEAGSSAIYARVMGGSTIENANSAKGKVAFPVLLAMVQGIYKICNLHLTICSSQLLPRR